MSQVTNLIYTAQQRFSTCIQLTRKSLEMALPAQQLRNSPTLKSFSFISASHIDPPQSVVPRTKLPGRHPPDSSTSYALFGRIKR
ncbi:unnamed protein product [Periconia digitata]|uniref:Uncharacterized protein n=1 Tax=Periconia digitata TaxID=1303443 RepID=A0A9W4UJ33_9PLEO|nr:unnamed protein product [Periconia digitata]